MDFNEMHSLSKHIDGQIKSLESKVACPLNMMYLNSNKGVKVMSMLKDMIENVESKKKNIEHMIKEENLSLASMAEDYQTIDKFKSEVVANLNKYENMWSSNYPDYKPFVAYDRGSLDNDKLDSSLLDNLSVNDVKQITDQSLNDSINITLSQ